MKHFIILGALFFFGIQSLFSQSKSTFTSKKFTIKQKTTSQPKYAETGFNPFLKNVTPPTPDGNSTKSYLLNQKIKSKKQFPYRETSTQLKKSSISGPKVGKDFGLKYTTPAGKDRYLLGGTPNDNTLAVSNGGIVLTSLNSKVYAYDLINDTTVFDKNYLSLKNMANDDDNHYYDPKLIYDELEDRFILVFLKNTEPETNKIMVCFSTSNNPNDDWNVFEIPGNPLDNNRWTDFPAISLTKTDLYITGNLIIPDSSWQVGFDGSVIWKINKESGYDPSIDLETTLFKDIKYDNKFIRNLHAVQGADGFIDKPYFLSNRNFSIQNDTIFVLSLEDKTSGSTEMELKINIGISDISYGVPPNARQFGTDTSDPSRGLQTNDGRVLGAIKIEDQIQFVSNSINTSTGFSSIFHGTIKNLQNPIITANIISDTIRDFGYPNIAWTGNEACDIETIIGFNHTAPTVFPGTSCIYYNNDGEYSDVVVLKEGENYVYRLGGGYERWGDYFGLQRKFNEPGKVYSFGFYGTENRANSGWINEVISPDTNKIEFSETYNKQAVFCEQTISITPTGGTPPYSYQWSDDVSNITNISNGLCKNDSVTVSVTDSRGCMMSKKLYSKTTFSSDKNLAFPNPFSDEIALHFSLVEDSEIDVIISDNKGNFSKSIINKVAKEGMNELKFSLTPLASGIYYVRIIAKGKTILTEKIVKQP